jgi:hypothetical protein
MTVQTGADRVVLGAPGVFYLPQVPQPRVAVERLDVAAFVGVAARGPAYEPVDDVALAAADVSHLRTVPVPVDSWDEYVELFGGFESPGLLPHAVAAYFAQGGRRAYVLRVVAPAGDGESAPAEASPPPGCAAFPLLPGVLELRARNEGSWGDRLQVTWSYTTRVLTASVTGGPGATEVLLDAGSAVALGSVLRLTPAATGAGSAAAGSSGAGSSGAGSAGAVGAADTGIVERVVRRGRPAGTGVDLVAVLRPGLPSGPGTVVELVEGRLAVTDTDPRRRREELFTGLGLQAAHPRFLVDVLRRDARLVAPLEGRCGGVLPDPGLLPVTRRVADESGTDRWDRVVPDHFFGGPEGADPAAREGIPALAGIDEVAAFVVPDLFAPPVTVTVPPPGSRPDGGPACFRPCRPATGPVGPVAAANPLLTGLTLDPTDPDGLTELVTRQRRLVAAAEALRTVALLDVPPGLNDAQVLRWRSWFGSSFAAAYHPWLRVVGPDPAGALVDVPPSAVAAGIVARCELREGIARGPANEIATGVVALAAPVTQAVHDRLHQLGVDVFRAGPDGIRLTGARTLSTDADLRQLTARRLLMEVERVVLRQLGWTVFEPAGDRLRAGIRRHLDQLLGELFDAGAFAGGTPAESWFVDVGLPEETGTGRLVVQVGVAPAQPLEFVLVTVVLDADGAQEPQLAVGGAVLPAVPTAGVGGTTGGAAGVAATGTGTAVRRG